jgi:hypothetical protein
LRRSSSTATTGGTLPRFDDRDALYRAMCEQGLEGVVAKRLSDRHRPGERRWLKRKNLANPRVQQERDAATRIRRSIGSLSVDRHRVGVPSPRLRHVAEPAGAFTEEPAAATARDPSRSASIGSGSRSTTVREPSSRGTVGAAAGERPPRQEDRLRDWPAGSFRP